MKAYLDGQFVDIDKASVSIADAAVQHGVGLFETMQAYHGKVFRADAHAQRLAASAAELGLTDRIDPDPLVEAVHLTVAKNKLAEARVRLTVTGGDLSLLAAARGKGKPKHRPTVFITAEPPTVYPDAFFTQGVMAVLADPKANPFDPAAGHKTLNYWTRLRTLVAAANAKAGEALWFTVTNHLCGGAVSNALLVKDGQIITPIARGEESDGALPSPVLPGITRAAVIEIADRLSIPVHRRMVTINDVLEADELMLTNSSWLVLPVVKVEAKAIGNGEPGPITRRLHSELLTVIESECSGGAGGAGPADGATGAGPVHEQAGRDAKGIDGESGNGDEQG